MRKCQLIAHAEQAFADFAIETHLVFVEALTFENAVLRKILAGDVVIAGLAAAFGRKRITLHGGRVEKHVEPVVVGQRIEYGGVVRGQLVGRVSQQVGIGNGLIAEHQVFIGVEQLGQTNRLLHAAVCFKIEHRRPRFPAFGRYQHHAVGSPRAVNGCSSRVFQHFHRFDVCDGKHVEAAGSRYTVYHIQRVVVAQCTHAAYAHRYVVAGRAGHLCDNYAGGLPLQCLIYAGDDQFADVSGFDRCNGRGYVAAYLAFVARHHHLLHELVFRPQRYFYEWAVLYGNGLGFKPHITDQQRCLPRSEGEGKAPVHIGDGSVVGAFFYYGGADQSLLVFLRNDHAGYFERLRRSCRKAAKKDD